MDTSVPYVLDGYHSVPYVLDGHHSVLYVLDQHHSGDCMYWMVTTVVTVCIELTTAVPVNSYMYHSKSCQPPQYTYSYKAVTEQTLNL